VRFAFSAEPNFDSRAAAQQIGAMMATLLVGYDLIKKLKAFDSWWHHLDSTWLIKVDKTPTAVRDELKEAIDENDELLVIDVSNDARAWAGFNAKGSKWLKDTF
jgi:hypothetical protein